MFLQIAPDFKINLNAVTSIMSEDNLHRLYLATAPANLDCVDEFNGGITVETNIERKGDAEIWVTNEAYKFAALTKWIESNTL